MVQSRRIRQCFGRLVDRKYSKEGYQAVLWEVGRLEMVQSRRFRECFGRLVEWKWSKVGVSGSALEGWSTGNGPK